MSEKLDRYGQKVVFITRYDDNQVACPRCGRKRTAGSEVPKAVMKEKLCRDCKAVEPGWPHVFAS